MSNDERMIREVSYVNRLALRIEATDPELQLLKEAAAQAERRARASAEHSDDRHEDPELRSAADAAYSRLMEHSARRRG